VFKIIFWTVYLFFERKIFDYVFHNDDHSSTSGSTNPNKKPKSGNISEPNQQKSQQPNTAFQTPGVNV
jgi:hypothetical protein